MPKILVVDDDKAATSLFLQALMMNHYEVVTLNESSQVLEVAAQQPNLIILDLMMPEPDGFQVCRMLRANPNLRRIPIIIVTALNDMDSRLVAIGAGANDYLVKPFHLDTLFNSVERLLNKPTDTGRLFPS